MKQRSSIAVAALAACMAMGLADVVFAPLGVHSLPDGTSIFVRFLLALGPGFLTLGAVYVLLAPASRFRAPVALALLLGRLLVFDQLFIAPKRAVLNNDVRHLRHAGQPLPQNYYLAMGAVHQALWAAGSGCAAAGALIVFGINSRRRRLPRPSESISATAAP